MHVGIRREQIVIEEQSIAPRRMHVRQIKIQVSHGIIPVPRVIRVLTDVRHRHHWVSRHGPFPGQMGMSQDQG